MEAETITFELDPVFLHGMLAGAAITIILVMIIFRIARSISQANYHRYDDDYRRRYQRQDDHRIYGILLLVGALWFTFQLVVPVKDATDDTSNGIDFPETFGHTDLSLAEFPKALPGDVEREGEKRTDATESNKGSPRAEEPAHSPEEAVHFLQIDVARHLADGRLRQKEHERRHPGRIWIAYSGKTEPFPYKLLLGPFPDQWTAKSAMGDGEIFYRHLRDDGLRLIMP